MSGLFQAADKFLGNNDTVKDIKTDIACKVVENEAKNFVKKCTGGGDEGEEKSGFDIGKFASGLVSNGGGNDNLASNVMNVISDVIPGGDKKDEDEGGAAEAVMGFCKNLF